MRFFASLVLGAFGMFLMSPIVAVAGDGSDIIIMGSLSFDICSTNITCEQTSEESYECYSTSVILSGLGGQVHQISASKTAPIVLAYPLFVQGERGCRDRGSQVDYIGPDTYLYPFVGIIKIQV